LRLSLGFRIRKIFLQGEAVDRGDELQRFLDFDGDFAQFMRIASKPGYKTHPSVGFFGSTNG
jgi:hypothetical protein